MKCRFSHIVPLLFLLFLLLPFISLLLLQGGQWYLKNTAGERMQHYRLETLSLPAAKAVWHNKGKELSIGGKLFDVKEYQLSDGLLTATGFYDEEEMSLAYLLSELTLPENSQALLHLMLVLQCFATPLPFFLLYPPGKNKVIHQAYRFFAFPHPVCRMAEQPPQH